jgi:glutamyl-tRNA synthetase
MIERGRFAPSPTGELHLGNARTALLAWLWARSEGGGFVLRIEDLDAPRVRQGLAERQMEELRWLGLDWDEEPMRQSLRAAAYAAALSSLGEHVYECFCSRAEIAAAASAPHGDEGTRYPGTCAGLSAAQRAERRRTRQPSLRLRVPEGTVSFDDEIAGPQSFDVQAATGDFILRRTDGIFAYQLAVVVDDAEQGMTQVLRGDDLLASTARQIVLYRLLHFREPRWAHAPLVLSAAGERLSKRDGPASLSMLRLAGADPRGIVSRLARASGITTGPAASTQELVSGFAPRLVPKGPVRL